MKIKEIKEIKDCVVGAINTFNQGQKKQEDLKKEKKSGIGLCQQISTAADSKLQNSYFFWALALTIVTLEDGEPSSPFVEALATHLIYQLTQKSSIYDQLTKPKKKSIRRTDNISPDELSVDYIAFSSSLRDLLISNFIVLVRQQIPPPLLDLFLSVVKDIKTVMLLLVSQEGEPDILLRTFQKPRIQFFNSISTATDCLPKDIVNIVLDYHDSASLFS